MNKFELLAPAGSYESFLAAIENGADAIYLGGKLFNARANANNFSIDELKKIVDYAHLRNVKIHVTMNTLINNNEINAALDFAYDLYNIGIDAVIVQDLGLAKVLHEKIPDLPLHASTQMSIYNLDGIKVLEELGFSRVVLARELSLNEIKNICDNTKMEIEIFIHGALCVCYSGQCLMSSMIGDRSGNRGKCAQPCRMNYTLIKKSENYKNGKKHIQEASCGNGYLLSPKDLCTIEYLHDLPNVTSLKIEGRMKSPEYVATVVSNYRKVIDSLDKSKPVCNIEQIEQSNNEDSLQNIKRNLAQVFNRGGFTDAYHHTKQGKDMMCYEKPKHWGIYLGKVKSYDGKKFITIDNENELQIGDGIEIWNGENESPSTIVSELINNKIGRINGNIHIGDKVFKTYDKKLMQNAKESYSRGFIKKQLVDLSLQIKLNSPIIVWINSFKYQSDIIPEKAKKNSITEKIVYEQFSKTGNTPFEIKNFKLDLDDNIFLPISQINNIRRNAFKMYEEYFLESIKRKRILKTPITIKQAQKHIDTPKELSLSVKYISNDLNLILPKVDHLYVPLREAIAKEDIFINLESKKYIIFPTITRNKYDSLIKNSITKLLKICDGFVISSICQLDYLYSLLSNHYSFLNNNDLKNSILKNKELVANYTFNTFNSFTIDRLEELGFNKVILSPELTNTQINNMTSSLKTELITYGNQCVMTSEYCPVGSICGGFSKNQKCNMPCTKNDKFFIRDRLGLDFRTIPDNIDCQCNIYNCKTTSIESKNVNVNSILINVIDEDIKEISKIIDIHQSGEKMTGDNFTNAHANRPV